MDRTLLCRLLTPSADDILDDLTERQHLKPHGCLAAALVASGSKLAFCASASWRAMNWMQIEPTESIGRLRRRQLIQLSRCIHRFARQVSLAAGEVRGEASLGETCADRADTLTPAS